MSDVILQHLTADELVNMVTDKLSEKIKTILQSVTPEPQKEEPLFYTREQAAKVLNISKPTLDTYTKEGKVIAHRIGTRKLYKPEDLKNALTKVNA